ncbi:MAG: DUF3822 family protein [Bacteroidales bacterium]|nr:DUF3822 family protein [Bacteroidales bacterium]
MPATGSSRLTMDETSVVAPRFDWRMTESYNMSIQLKLDGLSFCILDPVTNVYMALTEVNLKEPDPNFAKQEEYILNSQVLAKKFRKVFVCIDSPAYTMLPTSLYDDTRIGSILALNGIKLRNDDKVLRNNIEMANSTTAFTIPNFLYFFLRTQFPNADIFHGTTPIVSSMLMKRQGDRTNRKSVTLLMANDNMTIVATENNELKLCNTFYCREVPDYTYMFLYVMEQLKFNVSEVPVSVSGNIYESDKRLIMMRRFVPKLEMAALPSFFDYAVQVADRQHRFNTLFLLPLCA